MLGDVRWRGFLAASRNYFVLALGYAVLPVFSQLICEQLNHSGKV